MFDLKPPRHTSTLPNPYAGLISDAGGVLYGTTNEGGKTNCNGGIRNDCGTVFKLMPPSTTGGAWTETVLHSFSGNDGGYPHAGLVFGADGALYGTTYAGGNANCGGAFGCGTVFKLTPPARGQTAWTEEVLWSFSGGDDGGNPQAGLLAGKSGTFYGTTDRTAFELATFAGQQGQPDCIGKSVSILAQNYGGLAAAAAALGYPSVSALQNAIATYCGE